ncbi:MAG: hypothetical protein LW630_04790 [Saprospiraceae bacterium]|jgi:hypothetical protein|nr:hypothetical protein [Saprospiraceae bacterium]
MDIHQAQRFVHKISLLLEDAQHSGQMTSIDRDVLLTYIRNLYEIFLHNQHVVRQPEESPIHTASIVQPEMPVQNVTVEAVKEETIVQAAQFIQPEVRPEVSTPIHEVPVALPTVVESPKVEHVAEETKPDHTSGLNAEALREIFAELTIRDLSDRLSMAPISDLSKSMGFNEKMLTQQELFGNNAQSFQDTLNALNACKNFDEAKDFLIRNIIPTYQWTSDTKLKKATHFVKLVRRRFQ